MAIFIMNERDKLAEKDQELISNQIESYEKQLRKDFRKNPQKTIDRIIASTAFYMDAPGYRTYKGRAGVAYLFQDLSKTSKTNLDFIGNYLADNADVLEVFTKGTLASYTNTKERNNEKKSDTKSLLTRYLDNYLKTFNFPHDVDKITKLVEAFSNNYYKYQSPKGEKQTLKEIYQKTFDAISENKSLQVSDAVIGYEIVDKTLTTDKVLTNVSLLNGATSGKFPKNDVAEVTNQEGSKVRVQFNKPNFASRLFGKGPTVKIQPVCEERAPPTTEQLKFAEQIADSFKLPKNPIKKDYKDAEKLIKQAYEKAQANSFSISSKESEVVNDACFVSHSSTKVQEEVKESIIELIRKEILEQQRSVLQQYLAEHLPNRLDEFDDDKKLQGFLENPANKALIEQATQATKADLEKIEISGYKKIHEKCRDQLKPLKWEGSENVKENIIRNDANEEICTLTETTHKTPSFTVTKQDGTEVTVNSYRTIDFPIKPDKAAGSIDLSIVALDENGNRPPASKAVYFTAHYEEGPEGKPLLKEISYPLPLKFIGEGKDAVGYIEHDSKIYTLPLTRGKYEEMKIEVAKNNNHPINLSKEEERSSDKVVTHATRIQESLTKNSLPSTTATVTPPVPKPRLSRSNTIG